jgi:hypothetical protein
MILCIVPSLETANEYLRNVSGGLSDVLLITRRKRTGGKMLCHTETSNIVQLQA